MRSGLPLRSLIVALSLSVLSVSPVSVQAQAGQRTTAAQKIDDAWQGTLHAGKDLRTVVKISKGADGTLQAQWYSIDQDPRPMPVKSTTFHDGELRLNVEDIEMHLYSQGGHAFGLRRTNLPATGWPDLVDKWLVTAGVLQQQ